MIGPASRLLLALSGAGLVLGFFYFAAVDERAGTMLLVFLGLAAFVAALATAGSAVPDQAPDVPADAPPPERRATTTGSAPRGSAWPAAAAVAVGVLAATAAAGGEVLIAGVVAVAVAAIGWFGKVWSEDATWSSRLHERLSYRLLVPVGLPVAMFLLALTIAASVSRILLAINKDASVAVALVVAVSVLGTCSWVAARPRISSSAIIALVVLAVAAVAGAGVTGVAAGERKFHPHEHEGNLVKVVAKGTKFDKDKITVPAGEKVEIEFVNEDGVYHNVAVYEGDGDDAAPVFNGEGFKGDDERLYEFESPEAGAYVFKCDFHPNMKGTFITEAR